MVKRTKQAPHLGPSQAVIDACVKAIAGVGDRVAAGEKPLSALERQRMLKLKRGGRATARKLAGIARESGLGGLVELEQMLANVDYSERLETLAVTAANLSALLTGLILQADGKAWKEAVKAYTLLKRLAADDPSLMAHLEPIVADFAQKKPRVKKSAAKPAMPPNVSPQG